MEYIDWIMSSAIFFLVIIGVITFLPNYIPINRTDYDSITSKNVLNSVEETINTYTIINPENDGEIYPYLINLDNNIGRGDSTFIVDNNKAYGLVYNKSHFYNFDANLDYNVPLTKIFTENFDDLNYLDTFTLEQGEPNISNGTLNIHTDDVIITNNDFTDYRGYLNTTADSIRVYFNYINSDRGFSCLISPTNFELQTNNGDTINQTEIEPKNTTWRKIGFGHVNSTSVFCSVDDINISGDYQWDTPTGKIEIYGIDTNSQIDDITLYKNNDLIAIPGQIDTNDLTVVSDGINALIYLFKNDPENNIRIVFTDSSELAINDATNITFVKNQEGENKLLFFSQAKEFWSFIKRRETIDLILSNWSIYNYPYYIKTTKETKYLWTKVDLAPNETKTIYVTKGIGGYYPTPDDVFGTDLKTLLTFTGSAVDESQYRYPTNLVNAVLTGDRFSNSDNAYNFNNDSSNQYVSLDGDPLVDATNFTISAWIRSLGKDTSTPYILGNKYSMDTKDGVGIVYTGDKIFIDAADNQLESSDNSIVQDTWYNIVAVGTTRSVKLYINGVQDGELTKEETIYAGNSFYIGNTKELSSPFTGDIDDIRIYTRELSLNEIENLSKIEPSIQVTEVTRDTKYKIDITNNENKELTNYVIRIPSSTMGLGDDDSLWITDNLFDEGIKENSLKLMLPGKYGNSYVTLNIVDEYGNTQSCGIRVIDPTLIRISDCDSNVIFKFRFKEGYILSQYPDIKIINNKTQIITSEKINNLQPVDYFLSLINNDVNIEKGINRNTFGGIYQTYSKYLDQKGIEKVVRVLIKPN